MSDPDPELVARMREAFSGHRLPVNLAARVAAKEVAAAWDEAIRIAEEEEYAGAYTIIAALRAVRDSQVKGGDDE